MSSRTIKLAYTATSPINPFSFLHGQNSYLAARGFKLHAVSSPGWHLDQLAQRDAMTVHPVKIARQVRPFADALSLLKLFVVYRRIRPDILHVSQSKAALLGAVAGWLARIPVRIFLVRGLASENARGPRRWLYRRLEWLTARCCHVTVCVSPSLLNFARAARILGPREGMVLANGMSNGIDVRRFNPTKVGGIDPAALPPAWRQCLGRDGTVVIGCVGRLARDKGIEDLAAAWLQLREEYPHALLLLVGPWETEEPVALTTRSALEADPRVWLPGEAADVAPFYQSIDVFVYPSHGTEGFPNAPMEAAAMGLPVIATNVVGCVDAVLPGRTGTLVPRADTTALATALRAYLNDPELRQRHGQAGRARVLRDFQQQPLWAAYHHLYLQLARRQGLFRLHTGRPGRTACRNRRRRAPLVPTVKRLADLFLALVALVLLAPLLVIVALAVRLLMGRPVLFRQRRPGLMGKPFTLLKFRSMTEAFDAAGQPLPEGARLTRFGRFLRRASLDELPQLWNVLLGNMSLVGPRPLLPEYLPFYTPRERLRFAVRPGITGWAQIHGRNLASWDERLQRDAWYVEHLSLALDLYILFRTVWMVWCGTGLAVDAQAVERRLDDQRQQRQADPGVGSLEVVESRDAMARRGRAVAVTGHGGQP